MNDKEIMVCVVCGNDRVTERWLYEYRVNDNSGYHIDRELVDYDCSVCGDVTEIIEIGLFKKIKNK